MLSNCYGEKAYSSSCISGSTADLDDNGIVDGIDYNIMFLSFQTLKERGLPVPQIAISPPILINPASKTPTPKKPNNNSQTSPAPKPTAQPATKTNSSQGGGLGGIMLFIFALLVLAGIGAAAFKFHLLDAVLKKKPAKASPNQPPTETATTDESTAQSDPAVLPQPETPANPPAEQSPANAQEQPIPADTTETPQATQPSDAPAEMTLNSSLIKPTTSQPEPAPVETPQETVPPTNTPANPQPNPQPPAEQTTTNETAAQPAASADTVEKSGFLKKVSADEQGTWVTVADDSGITRGFYKATNVTDGFVKIKGTMKTDAENKPYLEITQVTPDG